MTDVASADSGDVLPVRLVGDDLAVPCVDGQERPYLNLDAGASTNALPVVARCACARADKNRAAMVRPPLVLVVDDEEKIRDLVRRYLDAGVTIERLDIDDLRTRIAQTDRGDITVTSQNLLRGSYNHLAAFERNLSRI